MAGDYRYGGMTNEQMANYLGISVPELQMVQEVIQGGAMSPGSMEQAMKFAGETGGGPMGGQNRLENIYRGIENIQQHPLGSRYKGFNPTSILANIATGGLYGVGKGLTSGDPMTMAAAGVVPMSPGGIAPINTELRGPESTLIAAGGALAGAGLAGGLSPDLIASGGFGTAEAGGAAAGGAGGAAAGGESLVPFTGNYTDAAAPGQWTPFTGNFTDVPFNPSAVGGVGAGTGGFGGGPLEQGLGALAAQQIGGMFAPQGGGGMPGSPQLGAPGAATPQRPGGAPSGSELDTPGAGYIDPAYIKRQKGGKNSRGISDQGDLSQQQQDARMAALYGFSGGMQ